MEKFVDISRPIFEASIWSKQGLVQSVIIYDKIYQIKQFLAFFWKIWPKTTVPAMAEEFLTELVECSSPIITRSSKKNPFGAKL